jgi:hypothetical protein
VLDIDVARDKNDVKSYMTMALTITRYGDAILYEGGKDVNDWRKTWKRHLYLHELWTNSCFG